jgi:hypothetical protein
MRRTLLTLVPIIALAVLIDANASAQTPGARTLTLTLTELTKGSQLAFVDNPPKTSSRDPSSSLGDLIIISTPLANATGRRTGTEYVTCTDVVAGHDAKALYSCQAIFKLPNGTLTIACLLRHPDHRLSPARGSSKQHRSRHRRHRDLRGRTRHIPLTHSTDRRTRHLQPDPITAHTNGTAAPDRSPVPRRKIRAPQLLWPRQQG